MNTYKIVHNGKIIEFETSLKRNYAIFAILFENPGMSTIKLEDGTIKVGNYQDGIILG